jgi:DNA polymerase-1
MTSRTLLAVDGNSLLHRSFHACARTGFRTTAGEPAWAVRGMLSQLIAAADRCCADVIVVGFDDPDVSTRRRRWPFYKAQRDPKLANVESQLRLATTVLADLGVAVVVAPGLEADDVLASTAAFAPTIGAGTVIVTSDRDSFSLIDRHTRMLRIINGGVEASPMLTEARLPLVTGVSPAQYRDLAALRGDSSDNLPGVTGVGAKTAVRILTEFGSAQAAFDDAEAGGERCRRTLGARVAARLADPSARATWQLNCEVMAMHTDVPLTGLADGHGRLPLDPSAVERTYRQFDLATGNAVRAFCLVGDRQPAAEDADPVGAAPSAGPDPAWMPRPVRSAARFPPLRVARPAFAQETLF